MSNRQLFESVCPPPDNVHWCDEKGVYVFDEYDGKYPDPGQNRLWFVWQAATDLTVGEPSGVWQFYQNGEWHVGSNTHNHRENTENAGYPTRDLYVYPPEISSDIKQEPVDSRHRAIISSLTGQQIGCTTGNGEDVWAEEPTVKLIPQSPDDCPDCADNTHPNRNNDDSWNPSRLY